MGNLHNEEFNDLYTSPSIVRVIKLRIMRQAEHVEHIRESRGGYRVLVGKPEGKRPLRKSWRRWEDNIKRIFRKWDVSVWIGSIWLRIGTVGGHF
jgi:hypothetical protein